MRGALAAALLVAWTPEAAPQLPGAEEIQVAVAPAETLQVQLAGEGTPVVMLPGFFGGAYSYRKIAEPLAAASYRVVIVDPLGTGASGRPMGVDYSLEAQARRIAAVLDSLRIDSALVVAHGISASIALRLALARPGLVRGIVSLDGGVAEAGGTPGLRRGLRVASLLQSLRLGALVKRRIRGEIVQTSGDPAWAADSVMDAYLAPLRQDGGATLDAYQAIASATEFVPLASRLVDVRIPIALLIGDAPHEGGVPPDQLDLMRERLRGLRVETVSGAGFWLHEERPEAVIAAVRRLGTP